MRDETPEITPALSQDLAQTLGFTRRDVELIERFAAEGERRALFAPSGMTFGLVDALGVDENEAEVRALRSLASRLAALLPPTADDGTPP